MGDLPLAIVANNWFSIHRNPGVIWEGIKKEEDKRHKIIEEFYDPVDSTRAIYRNFWTRNLRNNRGSTFKVGDIFDKKDAFGAYAKDPKPYFDTLEDFGYTLDSVIDLRDRDSIGKFFNYLASIEIGREYFDKNISQEEKQRVINEGINKGLDSLINDEDYKYKDQFNKEMSTPLISIEFGEDKEQMQQGGFIRQPKMINDPNAAPAALRADDIELQAQEGDFIMGYPAMQQSGTRVRSLVEQAMLKAKNAGVKTKGYKKGDKVDILVHNKEMHIPKEIIPYIGGGYATLKKLNQPSKHQDGGFVDKMAVLRGEEQQQQEEFAQQREQEFAQDPRSQAIAGVTEEEEQEKKRTDLEKLHSDVRGVHRNETLATLTSPEKGNGDFNFGRSTTLPGIAMNGTYGQQQWEKMKEKLSIMVNNYVKKTPHVNYENLFNLYVSTVKNIKEGVEESDAPIRTNLLLDDKFLKNAFKATEVHTKLNVANKSKSGEELTYDVKIEGNSLMFNYPHGTPNLMEKTKTIPKVADEDVKYTAEEGANSNWLSQLRNAESDDAKLDLNSAGGFGYSNIDHHVKMPSYLQDMIPYIKEVEGYTDEPKKEPLEKKLYTIYWGHQLTANQLEDYKTGKLELDDEDILKKDLIEADMLAEKVYNKYLKSKKFKEVASDLGLDATGPNYKNLPDTSKKMLVDLAFNLGSRPKLKFGDLDAGLKGYVKFMAGAANNNYKIMLQEYKRYYTSTTGTLKESTRRNNKFRNTFLYKLDEVMGNKKINPETLINHLDVLR
tara:strand:+ start:23 stop:2356 length:2334 start_codon:yes stop_codon:yes gene_type:complete